MGSAGCGTRLTHELFRDFRKRRLRVERLKKKTASLPKAPTEKYGAGFEPTFAHESKLGESAFLFE